MADEPMTMREAFERALSKNPHRWREAPRSGQATVIVGARPSGIKVANDDLDPQDISSDEPKA
jgi:hypothetical protein